MLGVISAEALKLTRHRATWGLVWIYPLVLLLVLAAVVAITLSDNGTPEAVQSPASWLEEAAGFWRAPPNTTLRILIAGFIAVAFAGEYGWNTWKLIVPHRSRWMLIAAKYLVAILLLLAAFILAAAIFNGIIWAEDRLSGDPIPTVSAGDLFGAHWAGLLTIVAPLLLTVAYASFASILTRSMIGALVVSIVAVVLEQTVANFGPLLARHLPEAMLFLFNALPGYHLSNLTSWITTGAADAVRFPSGAVVAAPAAVSLANVAAWTGVLVALTFWRFGRQDIN